MEVRPFYEGLTSNQTHNCWIILRLGNGSRVLRVLQHPLLARDGARYTACNKFNLGRGLVSHPNLIWFCSLTLSAPNNR